MTIDISSKMDAIRLNKLRRQFMNLYKLDPKNDLNETSKLFVQFVASSNRE